MPVCSRNIQTSRLAPQFDRHTGGTLLCTDMDSWWRLSAWGEAGGWLGVPAGASGGPGPCPAGGWGASGPWTGAAAAKEGARSSRFGWGGGGQIEAAEAWVAIRFAYQSGVHMRAVAQV